MDRLDLRSAAASTGLYLRSQLFGLLPRPLLLGCASPVGWYCFSAAQLLGEARATMGFSGRRSSCLAARRLTAPEGPSLARIPLSPDGARARANARYYQVEAAALAAVGSSASLSCSETFSLDRLWGSPFPRLQWDSAGHPVQYRPVQYRLRPLVAHLQDDYQTGRGARYRRSTVFIGRFNPFPR